jgi:hypothetical protein
LLGFLSFGFEELAKAKKINEDWILEGFEVIFTLFTYDLSAHNFKSLLKITCMISSAFKEAVESSENNTLLVLSLE